MTKIKTHQATAKRYKKTGTAKLLRRKAGQDHFNSRESGKVKRNKRRDIDASATLRKTIATLTPYN